MKDTKEKKYNPAVCEIETKILAQLLFVILVFYGLGQGLFCISLVLDVNLILHFYKPAILLFTPFLVILLASNRNETEVNE